MNLPNEQLMKKSVSMAVQQMSHGENGIFGFYWEAGWRKFLQELTNVGFYGLQISEATGDLHSVLMTIRKKLLTFICESFLFL